MHSLMPACPVCKNCLIEPVEFCGRCGCHVLLLLKILNEADAESQAASRIKKEEQDKQDRERHQG